MRASAILSLGLAAIAASSPIESRDASGNTFEITNFVYGCTSTCDWSFDVTITGSQANHPAVTKPVHCAGSLTDTNFVQCSAISSTQSLSAYIKKSNNQLRLDYNLQKPKQGAYYDYFGHKKVGAATGPNPSPSDFTVQQSRVTAVA